MSYNSLFAISGQVNTREDGAVNFNVHQHNEPRLNLPPPGQGYTITVMPCSSPPRKVRKLQNGVMKMQPIHNECPGDRLHSVRKRGSRKRSRKQMLADDPVVDSSFDDKMEKLLRICDEINSNHDAFMASIEKIGNTGPPLSVRLKAHLQKKRKKALNKRGQSESIMEDPKCVSSVNTDVSQQIVDENMTVDSDSVSGQMQNEEPSKEKTLTLEEWKRKLEVAEEKLSVMMRYEQVLEQTKVAEARLNSI